MINKFHFVELKTKGADKKVSSFPLYYMVNFLLEIEICYTLSGVIARLNVYFITYRV